MILTSVAGIAAGWLIYRAVRQSSAGPLVPVFEPFDEVDLAADASFPSSDPPSSSGAHA